MTQQLCIFIGIGIAKLLLLYLSLLLLIQLIKPHHAFYIFITPIMMTFFLAYIYQVGAKGAEGIGRVYRGGVHFNISLFVSVIVFYLFAVMQTVFIKNRVILLTTVLYGSFYAFSLFVLGGYYGGWSNPLRTMYFHLCSAFIFYAPIFFKKVE